MFEQEILFDIHNEIKINHVNKYDEYPEQFFICKIYKTRWLRLEIGGNIGRNSCVISKILNDSNNLLVIESDPLSVSKLEDNKISTHSVLK